MKGRIVVTTLGAALAAGFVIAQETPEVTVEAARTVQISRTSSGVPIEEISLKRRVSYSDLDLAMEAGVATLEKRVTEAANGACKELDKMYPLTAPSEMSCSKAATDDAMKQVHAAVEKAMQAKK